MRQKAYFLFTKCRIISWQKHSFSPISYTFLLWRHLLISFALACATLLGTLWTPANGFQAFVQNEGNRPVQIVAVRATYLKSGQIDSGEVPDANNFQHVVVRVKPTTVLPWSSAEIAFTLPGGVRDDLFYDADVICK